MLFKERSNISYSSFLSLKTKSKSSYLEKELKLSCVSASGNPGLCKRYVACADDFPKPLKDVFDDCRDSIFPDGFGKCNRKETLYKSKDKKIKFEECFLTNLPQYKNLNSDEDKAVQKSENCIYKRGRECFTAEETAN
ncbi:uncharacterized protein NPIL_616861 [Nephila pilipes]|uniref:Uncharacterized protein n=1 Tax=Nephila pilipes TaxID=299642 RepID=A0A8X6P6D8_NEPPI|nr:uncharacterized protein NPIL_616861 [Nephila pilipes]